MSKIRCHMIGNAHLDPVWLWSWREGFQENTATMLSALERSDRHEEFIFTSTSAQFYQWIEENEPEMFERIRRKIQEGKWVICGGWWVQPDCNVPSGESFAHHALLAQNYFYEKFGVTAHTGYCVDSFGHNDMLPQILKEAGMDNYVFMRPSEREMELPSSLFLWEAPDGSRVTAYRLALQYGFCINMEENLDRCLALATAQEKMMFFYGVGNHGGGPTEQNLRDIYAIREKRPELDIEFSTPDRFFAEIDKEKLPVVKGGLHHHSAGCYAVNTEIKRLNRRAENTLVSAEKFSALAAAWRGKSSESMNRAWENLLFNQFHDTLAGTALHDSYVDARDQIGETISVADRCRNRAIQAISFHVDIPYDPSVRPIIVFNPHSWTVRTPVELEFQQTLPTFVTDSITIEDREGKRIPCQFIQSACVTEDRVRYTFLAEIPPMGYNTYFMRAAALEKRPEPDQKPILENDLLRVTFDEEYGGISSIFDKRTGKEVLSGTTRAAVYEDFGDTWGHTTKNIDKQVGEFVPVTFRVLDDGDVRRTIQVVSKYRESTLTQTYSIYAGDDKISVCSKVNWQEPRRTLKFCFPVNAANPKATCEIPFGFSEKTLSGHEEPMQRWADVSGGGVGLSVLNDEKYGVSFVDSELRMTVLRCEAYAHHDPQKLNENLDYDFIDQGLQQFRYQLKVHAGDWKRAGTVQDAMLLNQPVIPNYETFHTGGLPQCNSALEISKKNILLSTMKIPYSGDGCILRLYEIYGEATETELTLFGKLIKTNFRPYEIKTLRVMQDGSSREVNFMEWDC